jgi:single-stranded DNA-binding protein
MDLSGRVTRDLKLAHTQKGKLVCTFDIAMGSRMRDTRGQWKIKTKVLDALLYLSLSIDDGYEFDNI